MAHNKFGREEKTVADKAGSRSTGAANWAREEDWSGMWEGYGI